MLGWYKSARLAAENCALDKTNELLMLLCSESKGLRKKETGLSIVKNEKSCRVTALGFKPETFPTLGGMLYSVELCLINSLMRKL